MLPIISYLLIGVLYDIFVMTPTIRNMNKKAMEEESEKNTFSTTIILILTAPIFYPFITIYATCIIIRRLYNRLITKIKQTKLYVTICDYFYIRY